MEVRFEPSGPLRGTLRPPPDKSISHRAALIGAMSEPLTAVEDFLDAADTSATLEALRRLGVRSSHSDEALLIQGVRPQDVPSADIDVGNAGTLLRILPGWLAGVQFGYWKLDGDQSIRSRPVDRIAEPLRAMGANVECRDDRFPPIMVHGSELTGTVYELRVASAQVKSCVLLAGLLAQGETTVVEPVPTRDHTERMLAKAGADIEVGEADGRRAITIRPAERLQLSWVWVPGDISSAAFPVVAAVLAPGSDIRLEGVGLNPTRTGLLDILERMGGSVEIEEQESKGEEPRGTLRVRSSELTATEVGGDEIPLAIDELPLVALAGCFAEGETVIRDASDLRHKESDRIAAVCDGLAAIGADVEPTPDGMAVRGTGGLRGGRLDSHGDHRLAMMGAVAGLASRDGVTVSGFEAASVSYPGFEADLASLVSGG